MKTISLIGDLILTEVLFAIIYVIAIFVLWEFIRARDGLLRKIMIAYFSVEVFTYLGSAVYFYYSWLLGRNAFNVDIFRFTIIIPKVAVKLWLLWWLKKGRYKKQQTSIDN